MRKTTGTISLIASAFAFVGVAEAGSMQGYNVTTTTTEQIGVVTIEPTQTIDTTYTTTTGSDAQVGEIIYNTEPYMPTDSSVTSYTTAADGTITFTDTTTTQ